MLRVLITVMGAAGLVGTALAQQISQQYDRSADFSKYKTYRWVTVEGSSSQISQLTAPNIMNAANAQLAQKGFALVPGESPVDMYVAFQAGVDSQKELNWYSSGGYWRWGGGMGSASTSTINVGTLALDMYDTARHQMIWRGTATKTLNPSKDPEKNYRNLEKAVAKLLKDFPPKPKQ